jgi:hypothetical protein
MKCSNLLKETNYQSSFKKKQISQAPVAHACNPIYMRDCDQEDCGQNSLGKNSS